MSKRYCLALLTLVTLVPGVAPAQSRFGRPPGGGSGSGHSPNQPYNPSHTAPFLFHPRNGTTPFIRSLWHLPQQDLAIIRRDPRLLPDLYKVYYGQLRTTFNGVSDEGLGLIFSTLVAYQLKPYRAFGDSSPRPANLSLGALMAAPKLMCKEYCYLAGQLFATFPASFRANGTVHVVAWNGGIFGNHGQLLATGTGAPLMLDPTTGIIAVADMQSLRAGRKTPAGQVYVQHFQWAYSSDYLTNWMQDFGHHVYVAVRHGLYRSADMQVVSDDLILVPGAPAVSLPAPGVP